MKIFCIEDFKTEFDNLIKKKSYYSSEIELYDYFKNKEIPNIFSATNLNNDPKRPYLKKRLEGRGGYRIYYYVLILEAKVYLGFIHPKTGAYGKETLNPKEIKENFKKILYSIKNNDLYEIIFEDKKLKFIKAK